MKTGRPNSSGAKPTTDPPGNPGFLFGMDGENKMILSERERTCRRRDVPTSEQSLPYAFELVDMTAKP